MKWRKRSIEELGGGKKKASEEFSWVILSLRRFQLMKVWEQSTQVVVIVVWDTHVGSETGQGESGTRGSGEGRARGLDSSDWR